MAQSFVSGLRPRGRAQSARVPESDGATARAGCRTLGIRSQRCLYACWRGRSMGPIFDHREAAAGVCGLPRTVCESAGERWHNGAGRLPDLKISAPSVVARILVWPGARDATDFRPSRNGVGGACASRRTACESVGGRSRDGAGSLPTLEIRSQSCLHTCWRGRSTRPIFDHRETVMGLCRLARTVCEHVRERWRDGAGSLPTFGIRPHRRLHPCFRGRSMGQIFNHREMVMPVGAVQTVPAGAHSLRESWRAMARRRGQFADLRYPVIPTLAHMLDPGLQPYSYRVRLLLRPYDQHLQPPREPCVRIRPHFECGCAPGPKQKAMGVLAVRAFRKRYGDTVRDRTARSCCTMGGI